jgi:hypothetical protein
MDEGPPFGDPHKLLPNCCEVRDLLRRRAPPHCTPRLTPSPTCFASRLTSLPATCTSLLTARHPGCLGLSI